jgi:two-component system, OmpR family, response regulator
MSATEHSADITNALVAGHEAGIAGSRHCSSPDATKLRAGPLELDLLQRRAWRGERELSLLPREFKLLEYLMRHPNQIVTRIMFLEDVWNYRLPPQTNLVDVHIGKIRRKVDGPGETRLIECIRRAGFMLHAPL